MKRLSWILSLLIIVVTAISIYNNRERDDAFLVEPLQQVEAYFSKRSVKNPKISKADVAWHLNHILKTVNKISESLLHSNPENFNPKFNVKRLWVHTTGRLPKGGQSPRSVNPSGTVLLDSLRIQLALAKKNMERISTLDEDAFFNHPVFDHLDRDQTRRFLAVHTRHHLRIIKAIVEE